MRVWLGLMGSILWASTLAQPARPIPVAYDAERDAYYVADELVVGLEPRAPAALASEVMLWVGRVCETVAPLGASVLRLDRTMDSDSVRELLLALPGVRYVERNYLVFACSDPMLSAAVGAGADPGVSSVGDGVAAAHGLYSHYRHRHRCQPS
jgi:hypothetical protein